MTLSDYLSDRPAVAGKPEADALREHGVMVECELLEVHLDPVRSTAWLLFDCRGGLQIRRGNTAAIAVEGVTSISWSGDSRLRHTAWTVVGWEPTIMGDTWSLTASFVPDAVLSVDARGCFFVVGNIPGGDGPPPDYVGDTVATIRAALATWSSSFVPEFSTSLIADSSPGE